MSSKLCPRSASANRRRTTPAAGSATTNFGRCLAPSGLSPRVRGNHVPLVADRHHQGSIPACAGEPWWVVVDGQDGKVYPRVCGGTTCRSWSMNTGRGLSPRGRGNRPASHYGDASTGSIPAWAGEPHPRCPAQYMDRVYPRVGGGTVPAAPDLRLVAGLSPRVRGNPGQFAAPVVPPRSIPACAGEPSTTRTTRSRPAVYPRVCGGTGLRCHRLRLRLGLSPRVRGNRALRPPRAGRVRSIPACAGEPTWTNWPRAAG